jgi:hypothetical protein
MTCRESTGEDVCTGGNRASVHIRSTASHAGAAGCDPNCKGACLDPNASDYACEGGSGDGPKYVAGPITVVGNDHFGLDRDGDGTASE